MGKDKKLKDYIQQLGEEIHKGKGLTGKYGAFNPLIKEVIQASPEGVEKIIDLTSIVSFELTTFP